MRLKIRIRSEACCLLQYPTYGCFTVRSDKDIDARSIHAPEVDATLEAGLLAKGLDEMNRLRALLCVHAVAVAGCVAHVHTTPRPTEAGSMSREQATQVLIHQGYRNISNLHKNGEDWIGTATKHGKPATVDIDKIGNINLISPQS